MTRKAWTIAAVLVAATVITACEGVLAPDPGGEDGDPTSLQVVYFANGADAGAPPVDSNTYSVGDQVIVLANTGSLVRDGFAFAGWNTSEDGTGITYMPGDSFDMGDAEVELFAVWIADGSPSYTISYNGNGADSGSAPASQTKTQGQPLTLAGNTGNLARAGFTFAGWNTQADGLGTDYAEGATFEVDADTTLYAKWTALPTYTISYNANGADSGSTPASQTKTQGQPLTLAGNTGSLARAGFTFGGWNTQADGLGTDYAEGATFEVDADTTLHAKWTALPTYSISYNANEATSGTAPASQTKTQGQPLTLASNTGNLARAGFTFGGWNTQADGLGTDYAEGATFDVDADTTLYAKWNALPTYTISYNANEATSGTAPASQTKTQGQPLILAENSGNLQKAGFLFDGWNTSPDGTGTDYAPAAPYQVDADLLLFAKWRVDSTQLIPPTTGTTYAVDAVDSDGDFVVVGVRLENNGEVYVYRRLSGNTYGSPTVLEPFGSGVQFAQFGASLAVDGDYIAVGAPFYTQDGNGGGAVFVYRRTGANEWNDVTVLLNPEAAILQGSYGRSVGLSGDYLAVGAPTYGQSSGRVYMYRRTGANAWDSGSIIESPNIDPGGEFGAAVAIDGDYVVAGAPLQTVSRQRRGAAWAFRRTGTNSWGESHAFPASVISGDDFGWSVGLSGDYAIVSAPGRANGFARIYRRTGPGNTWDTGFTVSRPDSNYNYFGEAVDVDGDLVVIGTRRAFVPGVGNEAGRAALYRRTGANLWERDESVDLAGDQRPSQWFGRAVALAGGYLVAAESLSSSWAAVRVVLLP